MLDRRIRSGICARSWKARWRSPSRASPASMSMTGGLSCPRTAIAPPVSRAFRLDDINKVEIVEHLALAAGSAPRPAISSFAKCSASRSGTVVHNRQCSASAARKILFRLPRQRDQHVGQKFALARPRAPRRGGPLTALGHLGLRQPAAYPGQDCKVCGFL